MEIRRSVCQLCGGVFEYKAYPSTTKRKYCSVKCGAKLSGKGNRGNKRPDLSARNRANPLRGANNGFYAKKHSQVSRRRISKKLKNVSAFKTLNRDPEFQIKRKIGWDKWWGDPEVRRQWFKSMAENRECPNKLERKLGALISQMFPGEYKFTGDGSFILAGLNPDWVNVNGQKKVIELFGEHVHHTREAFCKVSPRATYRGRKKAFAEFGYDTLIIWSKELRDMGAVAVKLRGFHEA